MKLHPLKTFHKFFDTKIASKCYLRKSQSWAKWDWTAREQLGSWARDKQNQKHVIIQMHKNISGPFALNFYDADSEQNKQIYKNHWEIMEENINFLSFLFFFHPDRREELRIKRRDLGHFHNTQGQSFENLKLECVGLKDIAYGLKSRGHNRKLYFKDHPKNFFLQWLRKVPEAWNLHHKWICHHLWTWDNRKGSTSLVRTSQSHRTHAPKSWARLLLSNRQQQLSTHRPTCDPSKLANMMHSDTDKWVFTYLSNKYLLSLYQEHGIP